MFMFSYGGGGGGSVCVCAAAVVGRARESTQSGKKRFRLSDASGR